MKREVLEKMQKILGDEHPNTITAIANLAITLGDQGKLEEAAAMEREVLEKRRKILGDEHPDTITAMANLAAILGAQDNLKGPANNLENHKDTPLVSPKSKKRRLLRALLEKLRRR